MAANILRMTDAETIKFLELYRNEPILWDPSREDYKKRNLRIAAARRIASAIDIDNFTHVYVMMKVKNLRSSYCQELKKISQSIKSGSFSDDVYVPKVKWFKLMDSFLRPHVKQKELQPSMEDSVTRESIESDTALKNEDPLSFEDHGLQFDEDDQPLTPKSESSKRMVELTPSSFSSKKVCSASVLNDMDSAIEKLDHIIERAATIQVAREDCLDHFGRYVASLLRSLPQDRSTQLQARIISMILEP